MFTTHSVSKSIAVLVLSLSLGFAAQAVEKSESDTAKGAEQAAITQETAGIRKRMDAATTLEQCKTVFNDHLQMMGNRAAKMQKRMAAASDGEHSCMKGAGHGQGGGGCCSGSHEKGSHGMHHGGDDDQDS